MATSPYKLAIEISANAQGVTAGVNTAEGAFKRLDGQLVASSANADRLAGALGRVAHYGLAGGTLALVASQVGEVSRRMFEASAAAQRLGTQLNFATDGRGVREMAYVEELSRRLGLNLQSTAQAYAGFASAARGTALQGTAAREVFEGIAKASAVMGLSADQTSGALLAVQQMMSKGTVSAEEFRGQLGERMPIALQAGAQALGVTTARFSEMLETGQIVAEDFLPKFARAIEQMLGDSVEAAANRLDAGVTRMGNAWQRLLKTVGDSGLAKSMADEAGAMAGYIDSLSDAMVRARDGGASGFMQIMAGLGTVLARMPFDTASLAANAFNASVNALSLGTVNLRTNLNLLPDALKSNAQQAALLEGNLAQAKDELARLQARAEVEGRHLYLQDAIARTAAYVAQLELAYNKQRELQAREGFRDSRTANQLAKDAEALIARRDKFLLNMAGVPDGYVKQVEELRELFQAGALSAQQYQESLAQLQRTLLSKTNPDAAKNAREGVQMALERSIGEVERAQAREQAVARRGLEVLDALRDAGLVVEADYHAQRRLLAEQDIATQEALVRRQIAAVQASGIEPKEKLKTIERYNAELEKLRQQGFDVEAADVNRLTVLAGKRRAATAEANLAQAHEAQEARARAITDYGDAINAAITSANTYQATVSEGIELTRLETSLIGASQEVRARTLAQFQVELDLRRRILEIQNNTKLSGDNKDRYIARAVEDAQRAMVNAANRVQLDEWGKTVEQVDTTFRDGFRAMLSRSEGTWSSYVKSLKNTFKFGLADELYKMFARPFVLQFMAGLTGIGGSAAASAAGASGMGTLASAGSLAGSLGAFGSGVATGWGSGWASLGGGIVNGLHTITSGAGAAQGLGMIAGDPMTMAIVLGLTAISKLFSSKGGPKQESWSGYSGSANDPWGRFSGSIQSGGSAGSQLAKDLATSITGTVKAALAAVGIAGALTTGVYASQDPKGDSPTQLDVQASLGGQSIYSRAARVGDIENVGRSEEDLKRAVARETLEVLLSAIKASGEAVPRFVERLTKDIGDASTADEINSALAAVAAFPDQVLGQLGTSRDTLASAFVEGLKTGDATLAGQTFAATLMVGIQDAMLGNFAQQVTGIVTNSILVPIMDSLAAGATLADAMASANIEQAVARAQAAADAFSALWGNAEFQAALATISNSVARVGQTAAAGSGFRVQYSLPTATSEATKDADKPEDKARALSIEIARLEGRTLAAVAMQREDELKTLDAASQVLQKRVYALQDEAAALEKTKALIAAFDQAVGSFQAEPERIRYSFERIARDLKSLGVVGEISVGELAQVLQATGQDQIAGVVRQFLSLNTVSDDTKIEVLGLVGAIGELKVQAADAERAVLDTGASLADVYQEIVDRAKVSGERVRDALSGITEGYVGAQERVASAQETMGNLARQAAAELRGFAKDIRAFVDDMDSSDLGGQSKRAQLAAAQARFAITSAQARAGDEDALKRLTREAGTVLNLSRETSRSQLAISRNADSVRATLGSIAADQERRAADKLAGIADAQDPTTKALKDLATAQDDLARWSQAVSISGAATERHTGDYLREWREATAEDDAARADLGAAVLTMQGVSVSQTTAMQRLSDAIAQYTTALLARDAYTGRNSAVPGPVDVGAVGQVSAGGPRVAAYSDSTLRQYIDAGLAQGGEAGARAAFSTIATSGRSLEDAAALYGADAGALRELAKSLGIPGFAVGTNFVPRDMLALVHQGEAIVPRPFNPAAHGAGRDADGQAELAAQMRAMAEQIRALSAEVVRLRQDNSAENFAIAQGAQESAFRLRKMDAIGIADRVAA